MTWERISFRTMLERVQGRTLVQERMIFSEKSMVKSGQEYLLDNGDKIGMSSVFQDFGHGLIESMPPAIYYLPKSSS